MDMIVVFFNDEEGAVVPNRHFLFLDAIYMFKETMLERWHLDYFFMKSSTIKSMSLIGWKKRKV
jgi:hypothetical protein